MMAVVRAFENKEYTLGRDGAIFFFLEYINYLDEVNAELENTERLIAMQSTVGANQHKNAAQKFDSHLKSKYFMKHFYLLINTSLLFQQLSAVLLYHQFVWLLSLSFYFAIDLSSHVTYAFVMATGSSKERVIHALESLGWPFFSFKFQSAVSTMAGISILYTYNAYIILTFFKTIWLTMVIGYYMSYCLSQFLLVFFLYYSTVIVALSSCLSYKILELRFATEVSFH
ncbi:unnamed protein product [Onchocerca flexuosa]|uniref:Transmembrane protein n=1 Tax=Onchocerca flexuosa TaxID=387005 RepID=A0A183HIN0_9BILA|nr:unnamed protein product [Onchocerca flexuosa]